MAEAFNPNGAKTDGPTRAERNSFHVLGWLGHGWRFARLFADAMVRQARIHELSRGGFMGRWLHMIAIAVVIACATDAAVRADSIGAKTLPTDKIIASENVRHLIITAIRSPSKVNSNGLDFFARRGKALLRVEFDLSSFLTLYPTSQQMNDEELGKLVATEIERLGRAASVKEAWPGIRPKAVIDRWLSEYPDLAVVPLSPDAGIVFTYSGGLIRNYDLDGTKIEDLLVAAADRLHAAVKARDAKHGNVPLERRDGEVQSLGFVLWEHIFPQVTPGSLVLSGAFWQDVREIYPAGAYLAFPGGIRPEDSADSVLIADKGKADARQLLRAAMKSLAERRRHIAENDPLCARLSKLHPDFKNPQVHWRYSTVINRCEETNRLKRLGLWVPRPDMPTSQYVYEWVGGKLVVVD